MKKLFMLSIISIFLTSCLSNSDFEQIQSNSSKKIIFHCGGDFSLESVSSITRSSNINASDIWIFDYVGGELEQMIHQQSGDSDFGNPILNLTYDEHKLYFVISNGHMPSIDYSTYNIQWEIPGDTFQETLDIEVTENSQTSFNVSMQRVAAKLVVKVKNGFPGNASMFRIVVPKWFYSINYMTGRAIHDKRFQYTTDISEAFKGVSSESEYEYYTLTETEETGYYTGAYIEVLDNNKESLVSARINLVELERGKCSTYSGSFTYNTDMNVLFNFTGSDWITGPQGTW